MFETLKEKFAEVFKSLRSRGKLTEKNIKDALRKVQLALLEADVNYKVVKEFIARVQEKAVGEKVLKSLLPAQQVIKIVQDELTRLLGGEVVRLKWSDKPPNVVMLVGLQGSGKTTTAAKLARLLQEEGHNPLLVACDVRRPAAVKQLQILGESLNIPVFSQGKSALDISRGAMKFASTTGRDVIILDTGGRLHIDDELMEELKEIKRILHPQETLLVVDAMTGQDAVNEAQEFNIRLGIDGAILTKLDGDARGGAALSIKAVTTKPIKFVGVGEKMDNFQPFYPDRMASRILGMGDVVSLVEKVQKEVKEEEAIALAKKIRKESLTLEDFLTQLKQVKRMGSLQELLEMIPGAGALKEAQVDEKEMTKIEAIICSMTPKERRDPAIINGSRRKRIAAGSGTSVQDVNRLLKQFVQAKRAIKQMGKIKKGLAIGGRLGGGLGAF